MIEERTRINERYIEHRDGFHPMTSDCVFYDSLRRREPCITLVEGATPPLFSDMGHDDMENFFKEYIVAEQGFKQPTVSKIWKRTLLAISDWIATNGVPVMIALFVIGSVAYSLVGG